MSKNFNTIDETLEYSTAPDQTNTDPRTLIAGSKNVLINRQRKVVTRNGFTRLGDANSALTGVRQSLTWGTSSGTELMLRIYDDELEVYLETVDGEELNDWYRVADGWSTTALPRFAPWYDDAEVIDVLLSVWGDDNIYEWNGAVAVVESADGTSITKEGTSTWAQNRFYTTGNKTLINPRTGNEHTYTGGEGTDTLTGLNNITDIQAGDVLFQKVVTTSNKPEADRNNHTIFVWQNQVCVGSDDDEEVYVSANDDYTDFAFSAPREPGEGATLTLDDTAKGYGELNDKLIVFAGKSSMYEVEPTEITVGSVLTETLKVKKYQAGTNQSAQSQETIVQIGQSIIYLSFEPAIRELVSLSEIEGGSQPRTLSNPIKPDFDAETWTNANAVWYKNAFYLSAPTNGRIYILEYVEDADGKLRRFWQPPQIMFIRPFSVFSGLLYGHSSVNPETFKLFDTDAFSDVNSDDEKMAIHAVAKFAYRNYDERVLEKTFDEHFTEGEISPSTKIDLTLNYDYGGHKQQITKVIDGTDLDILLETLASTSLGQQPLGQSPLGGSLNVPENTAKFRVIFEIAREDFTEMQEIYETNDVDKYWAIISRGANAQLSRRQNVTIKK